MLYKLRDWINPNALDWSNVCTLDNIDFLLDQYVDRICWKTLCKYTKNILFLEKHYGKNWFIKFKDLKNEVSDEHLSSLSVTVAKWIYEKSKVSNDYIESSRPSKVLNFIKLFLEQEKKRKYIKSYNITDIILLNLLSKNISLDALDKIESKMDYKMCLLFEKEIGYKETN